MGINKASFLLNYQIVLLWSNSDPSRLSSASAPNLSKHPALALLSALFVDTAFIQKDSKRSNAYISAVPLLVTPNLYVVNRFVPFLFLLA